MINRYDKGFDLKVPNKLFVTPVDVLGKVLEKRQTAYDKNLAAIEEIPLIADKIKAIGYHKEIVGDVINKYYGELLDAANTKGGDFSLLAPKLHSVKSRLLREISPTGRLGQINNYATMYEEWQKTNKNDKDIDQDLYYKMANHIVSRTVNDYDSYTSKGQFTLDSSILNYNVPKSLSHIYKNAIEVGNKVPYQKGTKLQRSINPVTGTIDVSKVETEYKDNNAISGSIGQYLMGDSDFQSQMRLRKMFGEDFDPSLFHATAVKASQSVKQDKALSIHNMSEYALDKTGLEKKDGGEQVNLQTARYNQYDPSKSKIYSTINGAAGSFPSPYFPISKNPMYKVFDANGKQIDYKDGDWNTYITNAANTVVDEIKQANGGNRRNNYESPAEAKIRANILKLKSKEELDHFMANSLPQILNDTYSTEVKGTTIPSKQKSNALDFFYNAAARGELVDINGNSIPLSQADRENLLKNKAMYPIFKIDDDQPTTGYGIQTDKGLYIARSYNPSDIQDANLVQDFYQFGRGVQYKTKDKNNKVFNIKDEDLTGQGNITRQIWQDK